MANYDLPDIKLNKQQSLALPLLIKWWNQRTKPLFQISGLAGTGKTTLIQFLIREIGLREEEVLFVAYIGKATLAMSLKGLNASTIHHAICNTYKKPILDEHQKPVMANGAPQYTVKFERKEALDPNIKLIVVDEAAMVPEKLADWLMRYKIPIIALGDLHQLPPIYGKSVFLQKPDVELTEIMRQSDDSPIPYLAKAICEGKIRFDKRDEYGDKIRIIRRYDRVDYDELFTEPDIILCGTNNHRDKLNNHIRSYIYKRTQEYPIIGDKLICRKNDWSRCIGDNIYLTNGLVGYVEDIHLETLHKDSIDIDFRPEFIPDDSFDNVTLDRTYLNLPYKFKKEYGGLLNRFEYGYAITCHLAQGSEYKHVLIDTSDIYFGTKTRVKQWLYTAVTRASEKVTILC